ncbi:1-alkyl-2-acetylglycerophosphocholine esterase [Malassezia sp. CBS 17886]|nr:1-alkyl-2-acetylglycerophosphocholine esterase [Malassezia sp. CBS 17886]
MKLPPYSGPFPVGAVDIEVPVREPCDYIPNYVDPLRVNKLVCKGRKVKAKDAGKVSAQLRAQMEEKDVSYDGDAEHDTDTHNEEIHKKIHEQKNAFLAEHGYKLRTTTLHFHTVLFTLYYPSSPRPKKELQRHPRVAWLGRPKHRTVRIAWQYMGQYGGLGRLLFPVLYTMVKTKMNARVALPLGDPSELLGSAGGDTTRGSDGALQTQRFPVVVFCHGLSGNRLAYSQFCCELASHGFIVAAIEHRDGSGMGSFMWSGVDSVLKTHAAGISEEARRRAKEDILRGASESVYEVPLDEKTDGPGQPYANYTKVPYLPFENLGLAPFSAEQGEKEIHLRQTQLAMRHAEIGEVLHVLRQLQAGEGAAVAAMRTRSLGSALCGPRKFRRLRRTYGVPHAGDLLQQFAGKMDLDAPALIGHSFGGATVIELLRTSQTDFPYGILLDPWMEPVRDPTKDKDVQGKLNKPVYVINSEAFSMWREQYEKLCRVLIDGISSNRLHRGWLVTLCGTNHGDFSDLPFLLPRIVGSSVPPREAMASFVAITLQQIESLRQQELLPDSPSGADAQAFAPGGLHIDGNPDAERPTERLLTRMRDQVMRRRTTVVEKRPLFWELFGWLKDAQKDPPTRAYRKHQRHEARNERRAARRAGADGTSTAGTASNASDTESDGGAAKGAPKEPYAPQFIDPRMHPDEDVWEGTVLDSDVRAVYNREGLALSGHLIVHTV